MAITAGQPILASDFINASSADPVPANNAGKVVKLESDGKISPNFAESGSYAMTAGETINGATLPVPVYQYYSDNEVYACDGDDTTKLKFLGFATSNSTDGNPITVKVLGVVSGFSGLDEGSTYYLGTTAGTIVKNPVASGTGVNTPVLVGIAISPTQLLIQKGRRHYSDTKQFSSGSTPQTEVVTCGFRPMSIRGFSILQLVGTGNTDQIVELFWQWNESNGFDGLRFAHKLDGTTTRTVGMGSVGLQDASGTAQVDIDITSVNDFGFTISQTPRNSTSTNASRHIYEVFGEI